MLTICIESQLKLICSSRGNVIHGIDRSSFDQNNKTDGGLYFYEFTVVEITSNFLSHKSSSSKRLPFEKECHCAIASILHII